MGISLPLLEPSTPPSSPKPAWLKVRAPGGPKYLRLKGLMREWNLHSVCEEAHCPNIGECWEDAHRDLHDPGRRLHAQLRLLRGHPRAAGSGRTARSPSAWAARWRELGLEHVVITSVNRDDLADGGAAHFAATIRRRPAPRARLPGGGADPRLPGQARRRSTP